MSAHKKLDMTEAWAREIAQMRESNESENVTDEGKGKGKERQEAIRESHKRRSSRRAERRVGSRRSGRVRHVSRPRRASQEEKDVVCLMSHQGRIHNPQS